MGENLLGAKDFKNKGWPMLEVMAILEKELAIISDAIGRAEGNSISDKGCAIAAVFLVFGALTLGYTAVSMLV